MSTNVIAYALAAAALSGLANAADVVFDSDPFAGSTALETPGRQVAANNERFLPEFNLDTDTFVLDDRFFDVSGPVSFFNGFAADLPASGGLNVIVLRDTVNPAGGAFNAGTAANIIANEIDVAGAGFFVYWNSGLLVNRLVYSVDLSRADADLSILSRELSPTGQDARDRLPFYAESNFRIVPAPGAAAVLTAASLLAARRRRA